MTDNIMFNSNYQQQHHSPLSSSSSPLSSSSTTIENIIINISNKTASPRTKAISKPGHHQQRPTNQPASQPSTRRRTLQPNVAAVTAAAAAAAAAAAEEEEEEEKKKKKKTEPVGRPNHTLTSRCSFLTARRNAVLPNASMQSTLRPRNSSSSRFTVGTSPNSAACRNSSSASAN